MSVGFLLETAHALSVLVVSASHIARISAHDTLVNSLHVWHASLTITMMITTLIIWTTRHHFKPPIGLANFFHVDLLFKLFINFYLFNSISST